MDWGPNCVVEVLTLLPLQGLSRRRIVHRGTMVLWGRDADLRYVCFCAFLLVEGVVGEDVVRDICVFFV